MGPGRPACWVDHAGQSASPRLVMSMLALCMTLPTLPAPPPAASLPCFVAAIAALVLFPQDNAVESFLA